MISFIVPIYNTAAYLPSCLDSLLKQTEKDLQVILVDDGSTDDSLPIAKRYAAQDERVEVYTQPHAGQSAARNLGMNHVDGDFIAFVDADDTIAPNWAAVHLQAIEGVDYVQSGYNDGQIPCHRYQFTSPCMRLYRRKAIEGLRFTEGMIYEDVVWSIDLWMRTLRCRRIRYGGYHYTANPYSTTSQRHPEAEQRVFAELKKRVQGASRRNKLILLYTIIRLKIHFLKS